MLWPPEWSDAEDSSRRSRSLRLNESADGLERGARAAAFAADRKLLVDGSWRRPCCDGGIEPCDRPMVPRPGMPREGVVARWISSGGGGEEGLGGGMSWDILFSGMNGGGNMLLGGGG